MRQNLFVLASGVLVNTSAHDESAELVLCGTLVGLIPIDSQEKRTILSLKQETGWNRAILRLAQS